MEIVKEARLKLTDKELTTLIEAKEILKDICFDCICNPEFCPLYNVCPAGNGTSLTIDQALGDIILEAVTE